MIERIKTDPAGLESELERTTEEFQAALDSLHNGLEQGLPSEELDRLWKTVKAAKAYQLGVKMMAKGQLVMEIAGVNVPSHLAGLIEELSIRPERVVAIGRLFSSATDYKQALDTVGTEHPDPRFDRLEIEV